MEIILCAKLGDCEVQVMSLIFEGITAIGVVFTLWYYFFWRKPKASHEQWSKAQATIPELDAAENVIISYRDTVLRAIDLNSEQSSRTVKSKTTNLRVAREPVAPALERLAESCRRIDDLEAKQTTKTRDVCAEIENCFNEAHKACVAWVNDRTTTKTENGEGQLSQSTEVRIANLRDPWKREFENSCEALRRRLRVIMHGTG